MNPAVEPAAGLEKSARVTAYPLPPQLEEYVDSPELMARSEPMAEASLPDIRARSKPGTAIAAMMPMIATTISSSIRVKPLLSRIFISDSFKRRIGTSWLDMEQPWCQDSSMAS